MTQNGILQIVVYFLIILALTKPSALFMARLFEGKRTFLHPVLRPLETLTYKLVGVNERTEQRWTQYTASLLAFSIFSFLFVYLLQRLQGALPLNPQGFDADPSDSPDLAFNTAVSFLTNTNWQSYSGESTLSYLVQMAALTVQNFASAAAGMAVAIAVVRGFARQQVNSLGNFWVDLTRASALHSAAALHRCGAVLLLAGRDSELPSLHRREDAGRRQADHRARAGRFAGSHQDGGHQRRRLLQRQLRASVREPHAARPTSCRCL